MCGDRIARVDAAFRNVDFRLVRYIAYHSRLCASAEERALRTFQYLDALEIHRIDVEVTRRQLSGLLVEVNCDVGKTSDATGSLEFFAAGRKTTHVDVALAGASASEGDIRHVFHIVLERSNVQLRQRFSRQCVNCDRDVLDALLSALRGDDNFSDLVRR